MTSGKRLSRDQLWGNILLVLGVSMLAGGVKYERQKFNQTALGQGRACFF